MKSRHPMIVMVCGALIVVIGMGIRQSFGLFLQPITQYLGEGREVFSLAMALQNLVFGLPLLGMVADRFGSRWVAAGGGLLYAAGLFSLSWVGEPTTLALILGLVVGIGLSSTSYVVVLGAVAQAVPPERRSFAFGMITAAGSLGMFALVPVAQWFLSAFGWQTAITLLALFAASITLLALGFPATAGRHPADPRKTQEVVPDSMPEILLKASRHGSYLLLTAGFFVCGFHVAFISTHLPAFLTDQAVSPQAGATALGMIGLFNLFGSSLFGYLGDRYRKKRLLSFLYFSRAVVISLFLLFPITNLTAILFGAAIGFLWLATVPLTSGMVAQIFGSRYLSTLYGIVFFSHQVGAFLGVWLGGRLYDSMGSYTPVWLAAIVLGIFAALIHLPISDWPAVPKKPAAVQLPLNKGV